MNFYKTQRDGRIGVYNATENKDIQKFKKEEVRSQKSEKFWEASTRSGRMPGYAFFSQTPNYEVLSRLVQSSSIIRPYETNEKDYKYSKLCLDKYYDGEYTRNPVVKVSKDLNQIYLFEEEIKFFLLPKATPTISSEGIEISNMISITGVLYLMQILEQNQFHRALSEMKKLGIGKEDLDRILSLYSINTEPEYTMSRADLALWIDSGLIKQDIAKVDKNIAASEEILRLHLR